MRGLVLSILLFVATVIGFISGTSSSDPSLSVASMCLTFPALIAIGWNLNTALRSEIRILGISIKREDGDFPGKRQSRLGVLERKGN